MDTRYPRSLATPPVQGQVWHARRAVALCLLSDYDLPVVGALYLQEQQVVEPLLDKIDISGHVVTYRFSRVIRNAGVLRKPLFVDFGQTDVDPFELPEAILWLPALFNLAPVIWAKGLDVSVPFTHAPLQEGLDAIRAEFARLYSKTNWSGSIRFDGPDMPSPKVGTRPVALYSGGLDSISTIFRRYAEKPSLVLLEMSKMEQESKIAATNAAGDFAQKFGLDLSIIPTNIDTFLLMDRLLIPDLRDERLSWWAGVQHGLGITGIAAPIAFALGAPTVYLGASYTAEDRAPWGSAPEIDDNVRWPGSQVSHDSFDRSRQEKLAHVVNDQVRGHLRPIIAVCNRPMGGVINCGKCEKCMRTMAGLMVEGENPSDWGFPTNVEHSTARIKAKFATGKVRVLDDQVFMWTDIKRHAAKSAVCPAELNTFLNSMDLAPMLKRSRRREALKIFVRAHSPQFLLRLIRRIKTAILHRAQLRGT